MMMLKLAVSWRCSRDIELWGLFVVHGAAGEMLIQYVMMMTGAVESLTNGRCAREINRVVSRDCRSFCEIWGPIPDRYAVWCGKLSDMEQCMDRVWLERRETPWLGEQDGVTRFISNRA